MHNRWGSSLLGQKFGSQAHVKAVPRRVTSVYYFIHRFAFCAKVLSEKLFNVLELSGQSRQNVNFKYSTV